MRGRGRACWQPTRDWLLICCLRGEGWYGERGCLILAEIRR
jgi:hypothetical protein